MSLHRCRPKKLLRYVRIGPSREWTATSWTRVSFRLIWTPDIHAMSRFVSAFTNSEQHAMLFLSSVSYAELRFGVKLAETPGTRSIAHAEKDRGRRPQIPPCLASRTTPPLAYADLKATLATTYLAKATAKGRPRWIEDWVDKTSGKKLQIDENDLWICAQAKERDFLVCTADRRMRRITDADPDVRLHIL